MEFVLVGRPAKPIHERFSKYHRQFCCLQSTGFHIVEKIPWRAWADKNQNLSPRGSISAFSQKSRARLGRRISEACNKWDGCTSSLVALTYHENQKNVGDAKQHLKAFLMRLRRRKCCDFIWWLEFQARGSVHFHLIIPEKIEKQWLVDAWGEITGQENDQDFRRFGVHVQFKKLRGPEAAAYAIKYGLKNDQKDPGAAIEWVGRFWGSSKGLESQKGVIELNERASVMLMAACEGMIEGTAGKRIRLHKGSFLMFKNDWEYDGKKCSTGGLYREQLIVLMGYFLRKGMLTTNPEWNDNDLTEAKKWNEKLGTYQTERDEGMGHGLEGLRALGRYQREQEIVGGSAYEFDQAEYDKFKEDVLKKRSYEDMKEFVLKQEE